MKYGLSNSHGLLYDVTDSTILLSNSVDLTDFGSTSSQQSISMYEIDKIHLRRKGRIWRSALIGLGAGAVAGALIGNMTHKENPDCFWFCFSRKDDTTLGAMGGSIVGILVGTFVGLARIGIPINGNKSNFKANQDRLINYSYKWGPYVVKSSNTKSNKKSAGPNGPAP